MNSVVALKVCGSWNVACEGMMQLNLCFKHQFIPWKTTHTTVKKRPFLRDYLSEPVPEETFTHSHLWRRKRRIRTHNKVCFVQQGLLDPIKPAYNQSRPNGRLWLTASFLNCMPAVLVTIPTVTQNSLHPLSTSSIIARHLLGFMQGKMTEADAPTIHLDATPTTLSVPPPQSSPHFYAVWPFCHNAASLFWLGTDAE